jgi:hypothetical protein
MSDLFPPGHGMPAAGSEDDSEGSALEDAEAFSSDYENEDGVKVQNGEYMDMAMLSEAYRLGVLNPDDQNVQAMLMSLTARVEAEDDDLASSNEDGSGPVDDDVAQEEVKVEELEGGDCSDVETKVKEEESPSPEKDKDPDSPATVDVD